MVNTKKSGADERRGFYSKATHILFAIVLGHSFLLAPDVIIPINIAFDPANHTAAMALMFSYTMIILGWIAYTRSVSRHPHKDTRWGVTRFTLSIVILFEYFYLLQISQTEHVADLPFVVAAIFGTYVISDWIKSREYGARYRKRFERRTRITVDAFALSTIIASFDSIINIDVLTFGLLTLLVFGFSTAKWHPHRKLQR